VRHVTRLLRVLVLATGGLVLPVLPAAAGALLSVDDLVRDAAGGGVAVVDNDLDGDARVVGWISPPSSLPVTQLRGVCVPDRQIVAGWLARNESHPGRPVWDVLLREGKTKQLVFLRPFVDDNGAPALRPTCEAEVLDGLTFAQHPGHEGFVGVVRQRLTPKAEASVPTQVPADQWGVTERAPAPASRGCG
jgi:hypothetical protein